MDRNELRANSFRFTERYRDIIRRIEATKNAEGVRIFVNALIDYALDGTEPNLEELPEWMGFVWENTKPLVDEAEREQLSSPSDDWGRSGRTLDDLSDEELSTLAEMYESYERYNNIRAHFKLRNHSVSQSKIEGVLDKWYGEQLKEYFLENEEDLLFVCETAGFDKETMLLEEVYKIRLSPQVLMEQFGDLEMLFCRFFSRNITVAITTLIGASSDLSFGQTVSREKWGLDQVCLREQLASSTQTLGL